LSSVSLKTPQTPEVGGPGLILLRLRHVSKESSPFQVLEEAKTATYKPSELFKSLVLLTVSVFGALALTFYK
jgi:hypothetical protein